MNGPRDNETGIGALHGADGRSILDKASYNLIIDHARIAGGLPHIRGEILNPPEGGFPPAAVGTEVLLHLQDGRRWECLLADTAGTLTPRTAAL
jgi:hypothetical protein